MVFAYHTGTDIPLFLSAVANLNSAVQSNSVVKCADCMLDLFTALKIIAETKQ